MRNSVDAINDIKEIKNISGRRGIRDETDNYNYEEISNRKKVMNNNEDRSISEPPQSRYSSSSSLTNNHTVVSSKNRLKTIREKMNDNNHQCSSDEEDFSKSNSQLNESDLDLEIPESASQTPTPTPLNVGNARRINSETNLNDSKRRLTGFMGNRSKRFCASTSELSFASHLDTHKSLFSPKNNQNSRPGSLYGSNMSLNSTNSRLFMINSPFYNGKTMFGGASAYPRRDINQFKVLRNPVQMRPSSSLSNSSNTSTKSEGGLLPESNAAKRILEIMTQFNGPLKETRNMGSNINSMIKIPGLVQNRKRFGEEDLHLDRSVSLTKPTAPYGRPINTGNSSSKNTPDSPLLFNSSSTNAPNSPQIPTMSQLLKMKRLQNNTERAREIANRSDNFLNKIHEYKLPNEDSAAGISSNATSSSSSLKMKNNITKNLLRNDKGNGSDHLPPAPLNLPNIQLPELKSIPKFDIKLPLTTTATATSSAISQSITSSFNVISNKPLTTTAKLANAATTSNQSTVLSSCNSNFKFSMPIILNAAAGEIETWKLKASPTDSFIFSKPLKITENHVHDKTNNETKETSSTTKSANDSLFKTLVAQQKSQWECDSCMTRNDSEKTKCLCCETERRDSGISSQKSSPSTMLKDSSSNITKTAASDDLFKKLAAQQKQSQWECDSCMTKNDIGKEKCMCCETPKPGSSSKSIVASNSLLTSSSSGFKFGMPSSISADLSAVKAVASDDLFKSLAAQQKKTQWECDSCLTRNDTDKESCMCCETPKPGSSSASNKTPFSSQGSILSTGTKFSSSNESIATPKFSFGMPSFTAVSPSASEISVASSKSSKSTDEGFKKIVEKQNASWECSACMTKNDLTRSKCICCEQTKPGLAESQSQFSFGSKASSVSLPAPSEVKFSFGVNPIQSNTASSTAMPAVAVVVSDSNKKDESTKELQQKDEVDKPKITSGGFSFGLSNSNNAENISKPSEISFSASSFIFKAPANNNNMSSSTTTTITTPTTTDASVTIQLQKADERKQQDEKKNDVIANESDTPKMFSFEGNNSQPKTPEKKVSFGVEIKAATDEQQQSKTPSGGFSFSSLTASAASPASAIFGSAATSNGGFAFGNLQKSTEAAKESPKSSGGFSFPASSFGSPAITPSATIATTPVQSTNLFSFGSQQKTDNVENSTASSTIKAPVTAIFGSASSLNTPSFGSAPSTFAFAAAKKDENAAPVFSFGSSSKPSPSVNSNMIFGSSLSANATPSMTPTFGSNSNNNSTPTFGSNNNNESAFGSKMSSFSSIQSSTTSNQPQKRAFDFGSVTQSSTLDVPQNKKFDFGSQQQQQQSQQSPASSTPFQFNAAQPESRPAFNFGASAAPSFNFTGNNNNIANANTSNLQQQQQTQQQQQPAVGASPIMQFGATTPTVAIAGINAFSTQQATGANAQNRKILRAARRTTARR